MEQQRQRQRQQRQLNQPQELSEDQFYPNEEMPHRRKQQKASQNKRRSLALNLALVIIFFLSLLLQVATWNRRPENEGQPHSSGYGTIGGMMTEPTQPLNNAVQQRRHLREVSSSSTIPFPKTLVGIFTTLDDPSKDWHRQNLGQQHPKQICALGDYESKLSFSEKEACRVIYTFVIGGSTDPNAPTELLTAPDGEKKKKAAHHSLLVKKNTSAAGERRSLPRDVHENDCTLLNIRYVLSTL